VAVIFLVGMQGALRGSWQGYAQPLVNHYADLLAAEIGSPPNLARAQALAERLPLRIRIEGPGGRWDSQPEADRRRHWNDDPLADSPWHPARTLADGSRVVFSLAEPARADRPRYIGWVTLIALLALTAVAYAFVHRMLRPLADIRAGALRFGAGDFSQAIPLRRRDELGVLAQQINSMAAGLRERLDAKRQLLLAISHELRSPLTRARVNAELVAEGPERDALLRDLAEMRDLITDLLESERLAAGHTALLREATDANALVAQVLTAHFPGRAVSLDLASALPAVALDPVQVKLMIRNLVDNALRHGGAAGTPPSVSTAIDGDALVVTVRDHGPGVGDEQLAHLAEAFYRSDSARARETGGVGLGLYLSRLVAQAHGGSLSFRHGTPGLVAEVRLPATG